ncbi:prepilin peptidase [Patescibacteria group bacterium]|nr:prepilin peptidase [Patescibacteria group bacterium]
MLPIQLLVFIFGLIIGSFLNVVILRIGEKSLFGRSGCMSCGKKLRWFELIPVFSFLLQKGKCRQCGNKISWQYPVVEILTASIFLLIFNYQFLIFNANSQSEFASLYPIPYTLYPHLIYLWVVFSILIAITVYDIHHKIIPDVLVFLFVGVSFIGLLFGVLGEITWTNLLAGPILATPFALLWLISQGKWIGFGDAKLALGIGWFMGLIDGVSSIILAFWIGAVFGILLVLLSKVNTLFFLKKHFTIKSEIPFAPFLILGMVLIFFFGWDILGIKLVVSSW